MKEGLGHFQSSKSGGGYSNFPSSPSNFNTQLVGRVLDIILDETHPKFNELGGYGSIGTVIFQTLNSSLDESTSPNYASPLDPYNKNYPLINELVYIRNLKIEGNNSKNKSGFYYSPPINIWNHPHQNSLPNLNKDLSELQGSDGKVNINLISKYYDGKFNERDDINPLRVFPGDIIYEGRFGHSIRLGSTFNNGYNKWSDYGDNGNPIIIIRNGQVKSQNDSWVPITEDINNDQASLYLTSNQKINIHSTVDFSGLKVSPPDPQEYIKSQAILTSERILINTEKEGVIINGREYVNISSINNIGISSRYSLTLTSNSINFGGVNATESMVLGNKLMNALSNLTETLSNMIDLLSLLQDFPGGTPTPSATGSAISLLKPQIDNLNILFSKGDLLSKIVKTNG